MLDKIKDYINKKIEINPNIIIFTFYEIRVKLNLYEYEASEFLEMCEEELEDLGYKVYYTGEKYMYNEIRRTVEENELMIGIKKK